jgi:hypothetical protein
MCSKLSAITQVVTERVRMSNEYETDDEKAIKYDKLYKPDELKYIKTHGAKNGFDLFNSTYRRVVENSEKYLKSISSDLRSDLKQYTKWPEINEDLAGITKEGGEEALAQYIATPSDWGENADQLMMLYEIRSLDYIFESCPLTTEDMYVYRGVTISDLNQFSTKFGTFVSVTVNLHIAKQFAPKNCCVFKIKIPKGSRLLSVRDLSRYPEQEELMLPRGSIFKPNGDEEVIDCIRVYHCDYIPPSSPKYDYEKLYDAILEIDKTGSFGKLSWDMTPMTRMRFGKILMIDEPDSDEESNEEDDEETSRKRARWDDDGEDDWAS